MKLRKLVLLPLTLIIFSFLFGIVLTSCDQSGGSVKTMKIDERLDKFFSDLLNNRDNVWKNFHPESNTRDTGKSATVYGDFPQESYSYTIDSLGDTTTITVKSISYDNQIMDFRMKEDGDDYWMILKIDTNNDGTWDHE